MRRLLGGPKTQEAELVATDVEGLAPVQRGLALVPADRRTTLVARPAGDGVTWDFVVRLQGDRETVFFDV